jgi:hypothetical protein
VFIFIEKTKTKTNVINRTFLNILVF